MSLCFSSVLCCPLLFPRKNDVRFVLPRILCYLYLYDTGRWFSLGTLVSSTNKTDRHDITEILLKVALNTITLYISRILLSKQFIYYTVCCLHPLTVTWCNWWNWNCLHSRCNWVHPDFKRGSCCLIFSICGVFAILSFLFWSLHCLSFFDIQLTFDGCIACSSKFDLRLTFDGCIACSSKFDLRLTFGGCINCSSKFDLRLIFGGCIAPSSKFYLQLTFGGCIACSSKFDLQLTFGDCIVCSSMFDLRLIFGGCIACSCKFDLQLTFGGCIACSSKFDLQLTFGGCITI